MKNVVRRKLVRAIEEEAIDCGRDGGSWVGLLYHPRLFIYKKKFQKSIVPRSMGFLGSSSIRQGWWILDIIAGGVPILPNIWKKTSEILVAKKVQD